MEKRKGEENTIFHIFDEESNSINGSTRDIKETILKLYSELYKNDAEDLNEQTEFLNSLAIKVSSGDKETLDKGLEETEIYDALKSLQNDKSPGAVGLTK